MLPPAVYQSVDGPVWSLRPLASIDGDLLLVAAIANWGGVTSDWMAPTVELQEWARAIPGAIRTHAWSAREYRSASSLPHVGRLAGQRGESWWRPPTTSGV